MKILVTDTGIETLETPLLAVPVFADETQRGTTFDVANTFFGAQLSQWVTEEGFKAESGKTLLIHMHDHAIRRVLLVGLGEVEDYKLESLRTFAATASKTGNARNLPSVALMLPEGLADQGRLNFSVMGAELGAYRYDKWLTKDVKPTTCHAVRLLNASPNGEDAESVVKQAQAAAAGVKFARDLVNGPPVEVTPGNLVSAAKEIAATNGLDLEVYGKAELKQMGMNLILAVGAGSEEEPQLIHLTWRPPNADATTGSIALIGKGITFDAGGYNLKPTGHIEDMKMDMAGAAAVLGAMKVIREVNPNLVVHGIVPTAENLISGAAYKDGDIIRSLNGKTVEIMNTDAEGRLILADALCYAERLGVDGMVDLATLTGACMVALGPHTAGLFAGQADLGERVKKAAKRAGEDVWQMPINKKLKRMLKSNIADMKNVGERWGGAITAALFLQEFVGDTPWVHLDIAGPALADKEDGHITKGATGFGVATLIELMKGEG